MGGLVNRIVDLSKAFVFLLILAAGCSHQPKTSEIVPAKGAFDELRSAVLREIKDQDRASKGVSLVDQLERILIEADNDRKTYDSRMRSLNANYDASEEDFRSILREFNKKRSDRQDRIFEINQQAKDLTTESEWKALIKVQEKMVQKTLETEQEM